MNGENQGIISTITVAEILTGFYIANDFERAVKMKNLFQDLTVNNFEIVPVTFDISDLAARLRRRRGGKLPDAVIVATAISKASDLLYSQDERLRRFSEDTKISKLE